MRQINSFDVFDTLIARRCVLPELIFEEVESISRFENFMAYRKQAESRIVSRGYTLDDIYREFANITGVSSDIIELLCSLEIQRELENAIPIQDNLDKVNNGDILITDMYLPRNVIEAMLRKIGLTKQIGLIVSAHGKSSGDIWPRVSSIVSISSHYGDSFYSDIKSPAAFDVYGKILKQSPLNDIERFYADNGLELLSRLMRECRLKVLSAKFSRERNMRHLLQVNYNMPILMLASVHLYLMAAEEGRFNFLFSARDCYAMEKLFRCLIGGAGLFFKSSYFLTSRISRVKASDSYVRYVDAVFTKDSVVVDLCGTGLSLSQLFHKTKVVPCVYFFQYLKHWAVLDEEGKLNGIINLKYLTDSADIKNVFFELLNYNLHGMLLDVSDIDGYDSMLPEFEDPEYPMAVKDAVGDILFAQEVFLDVLKNYKPIDLIKEASDFISSACVAGFIGDVYEKMTGEMSCMQDVMDYHSTQNNKTVWRLSKVCGNYNAP